MLRGTASVTNFERGAPTLKDFDSEALVLPGASVLQVLYEIDSDDICEMMPPALHPTLPPVVSWSFYCFPETPWGEVNLAQTRLECRSGLRPRDSPGLPIGGLPLSPHFLLLILYSCSNPFVMKML